MTPTKLLKDEDVKWPFEGQPSYFIKVGDSYGLSITIDPFPCYAHNPELVFSLADRMSNLFPIGIDTHYFLLSHEEIGRCNGSAHKEHIYKNNSEPYPIQPIIILSGKRIPIHPAMTNYLVAHEYGHVVQYWIEHKMTLADSKSASDKFIKEYAKTRNIDIDVGYGGRKWHKNINEIIVNDFRIVIGGSETNFWPHDCVHPLQCPAIVEYWKTLKQEYSVTDYVQNFDI